MPSPIQAVTFDAAGTLIHLTEPLGETYSRIAAEQGHPAEPDQLEKAFRRAWKESPALHADASGTTHDPDTAERDWWREVVARTFALAGKPLPAAHFDAVFSSLFAEFSRPERWALFPEVRAVVETLRAAGIPIAIISNFDRRFHRIADGLGLKDLFDAIILSGEWGKAKPHPSLFLAAAQHLHVPSSSILHAGDDPIADWQGGRDAGLQVFELRRPENTLGCLLSILNLEGL